MGVPTLFLVQVTNGIVYNNNCCTHGPGTAAIQYYDNLGGSQIFWTYTSQPLLLIAHIKLMKALQL